MLNYLLARRQILHFACELKIKLKTIDINYWIGNGISVHCLHILNYFNYLITAHL